jgi:glycosyltransferase involved in cell wall biosynthesis
MDRKPMPAADRRVRSHPAATAVIVVLNLPVPDDHRVWAQAEALRDDGVAVTVVCPAIQGKAARRTVIDGIDVVYFPTRTGTGPLGVVVEGAWSAMASSRAAKQAVAEATGARMVQVCNPPDLLSGLLRWARRHGCTTVYDQHDVVPALAEARGTARRLRGVFEFCERRTVHAADVVITPSQEQVDRLRARYGREAILVRTAEVEEAGPEPDKRTSPLPDTVPHAADGPPAQQDAHMDERPAEAATVLGYLGLISEQDGVSELIDAVCELRRRGASGFRVEIAGDGPTLRSVRRKAELRGVADLVAFHGWLDRAGVCEFLERIDAMVVPDPDLEFNHYCAMNKVTFAMARGLPVVLRPLRENARLVGDSPFLAADLTQSAFADAIEALLRAGPQRRREVGDGGRRRYEREFAWDINGPRYLVSVSPGSRA